MQEKESNDISNFQVYQTMLLKEEKGKLKNLIHIEFESKVASRRNILKVKMPNYEDTLRLPFIIEGKNVFEFTVPEVEKTAPLTLVLTVENKQYQFQLSLTKKKRWKIFLVHFSHQDIGYTDLPSVCEEQHKQYFDDIIRYCRETETYPEGSRFKWTCDGAWAVKNYLEDRRYSKNIKEFVELAKVGKIEVSAQYAFLNSALIGHEELVRSIYYAHHLQNSYGIPVKSAMSTDITGHPWGYAQILASSGIKYLSTAVNIGAYSEQGQPRAKVPEISRPFYWVTADGSKVLVWNSDPNLTYQEGWWLGFTQSYERVGQLLPSYLASLEKEGYPYDAIHLRVTGRRGDNTPPNKEICNIAKEWNERFAYPKFIVSTNTEFFQYMESSFADKFTHCRGDWTDWWADGPASSAYETGINRITHFILSTAEKASTLASMKNSNFQYPKEEMEKAYDEMMLFNEHTWGMWDCETNPNGYKTKIHWRVKASYAHDARWMSEDILSRAMSAISSGGDKKDDKAGILVFNPLSWKRTELVKISINQEIFDPEKNFIKESKTGELLPFQVIDYVRDKGEYALLFLARNVPSLGYSFYEISKEKMKNSCIEIPVRVKDTIIDNQYYKVRLDKDTGGIASIYDKELRREIIDEESSYRLNQIIYDEGEPPTQNKRILSQGTEITPGKQGKLFSSIISLTKIKMCPQVKQEVILYSNLKRIDIVNTIDKIETLEKEGVYYAFPMIVPDGKFNIEIAGSVISPNEDQIPGSCKDWYSMQSWLNISNQEFGITFSSREAPVLSLCDINTGRLLGKLEISNTSFFAYLMNNYWNNNFKERQGGRLTFRFSITSGKEQRNRSKGARFGWSYRTPLVSKILKPKTYSISTLSTSSFLQIDDETVILLTLKQAEDRKGYIVRLLNIEEGKRVVRLTFNKNEVVKAYQATPVEDNIKEIKISLHDVFMPIEKLGLETIRIICRE